MSLNISRSLRNILAVTALGTTLLASGMESSIAGEMGRENSPRHSRGRDFGTSVGVGVGLGIINQLIEQERDRQIEDEFEKEIAREKAWKKKRKRKKSTKKKNSHKKKKSSKRKKRAKKKEKGAPTVAETVALTPPPFPRVWLLSNCKQCQALWFNIFKYITIIQEDSLKLKARERELANRRAELKRLRTQRRGASTSADRIYYTSLTKIRENSIRELVKLNEGLRELVEWEKRILQERLTWYEDCSKRHCTKPPVASEPSEPEGPTPTPVTVAPPPVVSTPEPVQTPPSTTTTTPPPTPIGVTPETPAISEPPISLRPPDNRKICGPDITPLVLDVLRDMKKQYDANPGKQAAACRALLDPKTGGHAWDIGQLSPTYAPDKGMHYDPATDEWVGKPKKDGDPVPRIKPWFTGTSKMCAIPREVCGATVEFLGTCQHAQVVNYTQWGMMLELCGGFYQLAGQVLHRVWNHAQYGSTAPTDAQRAMLFIGQSLKKQLDEDTGNGKFKPDIEALKKQLQKDDSAISHPEQQCELKCKLTPAQRAKLYSEPFRFNWIGLKRRVSPSERTSPREIPDQARKASGG